MLAGPEWMPERGWVHGRHPVAPRSTAHGRRHRPGTPDRSGGGGPGGWRPGGPRGRPGCGGRGQRVGPVIAVRGAVALVAVGVVVTVAHLAGPGAAGLVSAFPTFSTALALLVARDLGTPGVAAVLTGTVRALPSYLVFCVT